MIVGNVDWNAAAVLCVFFIGLSIVVTSVIAKRRSKQELTMQFEVDKQKLKNADDESKRNCQRQLEYDLSKLAVEKDVQIRRIETGLIEGKVN